MIEPMTNSLLGSSMSETKLNKSSSTAGVVQVEENLPETNAACSIFLLQMHNKKMSDLKNSYEGHVV